MFIYLEITETNNQTKIFPLEQNLIKIGRALDNNLILNQPIISRHHAQIKNEKNQYILIDLGSADGTIVNGQKITAKSPYILQDNNIFKIGTYRLKFCINYQSNSNLSRFKIDEETQLLSQDLLLKDISFQKLKLEINQILTIGRSNGNDIIINSFSVSRHHAKIEYGDNNFYLKDLNSSNGTYLNNELIESNKPYLLKIGDNIHICTNCFIFNEDGTFTRQNEEGNLRMDAINLNQKVSKKVNLLQNISFSILPKEFVVVAGVSGGGKSTLLNALNGFKPATNGQVFVNNIDLYQNKDVYRSQIGYVPQKDIIHQSLTVKQTLEYAAKLRMSSDILPQERQQRVKEVIADLELEERQNVAVNKLSGGQLKRVSMGVELLTKPSLFFLDEVTSGLDPGTESEMMRLLRKLADDGRIILLITHATENVMSCDLVIFLAKGGYLAFYGKPEEALEHFKVEKFTQIYRLVEKEKSPQQWQNYYRNSSYYETYIQQRQANLTINNNLLSSSSNQSNFSSNIFNIKTFNFQKSYQQFLTLFSRNFSILITDKINLLLILLIAPVLGCLDFILWKKDLFDIKTGDAQQSLMMLFVTVIIAIMVGSLSSMREIVKDKDIYQREKMVFLQTIPYIASKVSLGILISLYQAGIFLLIKIIAIDFPQESTIILSLYITLALTTIAGMVMGLLVSAISPNQNIAQLLIILFIIPQFMFGTGFLPTNALNNSSKLISNLTISKWSFETIISITNMGKDIAKDDCFVNYSKAKSDIEKAKNCICLGKNLFKRCYFPGIKDKYVFAVDEIEPQKPHSVEISPDDSSQIELYKNKVDQYEKEINLWQDKYSDWKGERESAIGEAEGIVNKFYQDYGTAFNVNLSEHWMKLTLIIFIMLGLIIVVQNFK